MRSLVILTVLAGAAGYGVIRQLPEGQAEADSAIASRTRTIESISIDGRGLTMPALRATLTSKAGDALDRTRLDHDRAALEAQLVSHGYLAAIVAAPQIAFDADDGALVTFEVAQGPLYHVHAVAVTGAAPRDAGVVTIASGDPVEADRLAHARDTLVARLTARGKRHAVELKVTKDDKSATVDVELAAK